MSDLDRSKRSAKDLEKLLLKKRICAKQLNADLTFAIQKLGNLKNTYTRPAVHLCKLQENVQAERYALKEMNLKLTSKQLMQRLIQMKFQLFDIRCNFRKKVADKELEIDTAKKRRGMLRWRKVQLKMRASDHLDVVKEQSAAAQDKIQTLKVLIILCMKD